NIVTMHRAKGLEWPIVIPVNMMSEFEHRSNFIYRSDGKTLHWSLGDVVSPSLREALVSERNQQREEGERLLYVVCTRAMALLILPAPTWSPAGSWATILDLGQAAIPEIELPERVYTPTPVVAREQNSQSAEIFDEERLAVEAASPPIRWQRPSRGDP